MNLKSHSRQWRWLTLIMACMVLSMPLFAQETTPEAIPVVQDEEETLITETPLAPAPEETPETVAPFEEVTPFVEEESSETPIAIEETTPEVIIIESPTAPILFDTFAETFEAFDASAWQLEGWALASDEVGSFLTTSTPLTTATVLVFSQDAFTLEARLRVSAGDVALLSVNGYTLMFDTSGNSRLYQGDTLLAVSPIAEDAVLPEVAEWFSVLVTVDTASLTLTVNGTPSLAYALSSTTASLISIASGETLQGEIAIDDLTLTKREPAVLVVEIVSTPIVIEAEVTPEPDGEVTAEPSAEMTAEAETTPEPEVTQEALASETADVNKLTGELEELAQAYRAGDFGVIDTLVLYHGFITDEQGRILIDIATNENGVDAVYSLLESAGGLVVGSTDSLIEAYVPVSSLDAIGLSPEVRGVRKTLGASSTAPNEAPNEAPAGDTFSDGFNAVGALDWHNAGVLGSGVLIGVIDTGFGVSAPSISGNLSCLNNNTLNSTGSFVSGDTTHGLKVVEILCDLAPSAKVNMYKANSYATLATAISQARTNNVKVLAITLDLGASETPGDGTNGGRTGNDPYALLATARSEGMVIFAAAGNSGNPSNIGNATKLSRYYAFNSGSSNSATTINATVSRGDVIRLSWNGWSETASNFTVTYSGAVSGGVTTRFDTAIPNGQFEVPSGCGDSCSITISVTPNGSASNKIFQLQIVPVFVTGETPPQTPNIKITSVSLATNASVVTGAGSIARPADSPDVIAVGAVCADDDSNFSILPESSAGPVYGSGGSAPSLTTATRANVKPDLMGASNVRVSGAAGNGAACDGTLLGAEDTVNLFGGSSAATAHLAGMAALMKSNTSNTSMSGFNIASATGVENIKSYLQTRIVDLPLNAPDGFDYASGAGFSILGFPNFSLTNSQNLGIIPNNLACAGGFSYVGQANANTANDGTLANPYLHIGNALNNAPANSCVVVMPGEYVTPLLVNNTVANNVTLISYDQADSSNAKNSLFRVVGQYLNSAGQITSSGYSAAYERFFANQGGIYVDNGTNDFTLSGFNFVPAKFQVGLGERTDVFAVFANNTDKVVISNNTFGQTTADGASYTGWVNMASHPITVYNGIVEITRNKFVGGTGAELTDYSTIAIVEATALVNINEFLNNNNIVNSSYENRAWKSTLYAESSAVDLIGNAFVNNQSQTLLMFRTPNFGDTADVRVVSNVFLQNNAAGALPIVSCGALPLAPCPGSGGLVKLFKVSDFYFVNNTVIANDRSNSAALNALIVRGGESVVPIPEANLTTEFHNNIVASGGVGLPTAAPLLRLMMYDDLTQVISFCRSVSSGNPVTNNWWADAITGPCSANDFSGLSQGGLSNPANIINAVTSAEFAGAEAGFPYPNTDWRFYALRQTQQFAAGDGTANSIKDAQYSFSVDRGRSVELMGLPFTGNNLNSPFNLDVTGNLRVLNIQVPNPADVNPPANIADNPDDIIAYQGEGVNAIDIGAFEFTPLRIDVDGDENNGLQTLYSDSMAEDSGVLEIDANSFVLGGFGQLTYQVSVAPLFYGTHCTTEFANSNGVVFGVGLDAGKIFYCPPIDFYNSNNGTTLIDSNLEIEFSYTVRDETFSTANGSVAVYVTPVQDALLTNIIGDDIPSGDLYELTLNAGVTVNVPLRPYVDFSGGFFFSEDENPEFDTDPRQIDYPFNYSTFAVNDCNAGASTLISVGSLTGNLLSITAGEIRGVACVTYSVTDAFGGTSALNTIRISVNSFIPSVAGLYDDSSFAFTYTNASITNTTGWSALFSPNNINNTLHTSKVFNDRADFAFQGTGFVLYMQGAGNGNDYMLTLNDAEPNTNWTLISGVVNQTAMYGTTFPATGGGDAFECYTRALPGSAVTPKSLSNKGAAYTVTCYSTQDNPTSKVYRVGIVNKRQGATLSVDAFSIMADTLSGTDRVLPPGNHEVDSAYLRGLFTDPWQLLTGGTVSNKVAYRTLTNASFSFYFEGGSGFAIETNQGKVGGDYTILVENDTLGSGSISQNISNAPFGNSTANANMVSRPFLGLDPETRYKVTLTVTNLPLNGNVIIDSIVVYPPTLQPEKVLPFGSTEDDSLTHFAFGGHVEDNWLSTFSQSSASNRTLTSIRGGKPSAGAILSFELPDDATGFLYDHAWSSSVSRRLMICVDRNRMATDYGNCIIVNQRPPTTADPTTHIVVNATTGATTNQITPVRVINGTLAINESLFDTAWGSGHNHTVEIFSLLNEVFNFDRITVFGEDSPLGAGFNDDTLPSIKYYTSSDALGTIGTFANNNNFLNTSNNFLRVINNARDTGRTITWTKQVGASVVFGFTGTGFAPRTRMERESDAVEICWQVWDATNDPLPTSANANWSGATCTTFDNQNPSLLQSVDRPILGLPNDTYSVRIKMLADNGTPALHTGTAPLNMYFDGVTVYDTNFASLIPVENSQTYDANYPLDILGNQFLYTGTTWAYSKRTSNRLSSLFDFSSIGNVVGASYVFRTLDAEGLTFTHQIGNFAPVRVCSLAVATGNYTCADVITKGSPTRINRVTLPLQTGEQIISIYSTNTGLFNLDAVTPLASYANSVPANDEIGEGYHETTQKIGNINTLNTKFTTTSPLILTSGAYSGGATLDLTNNASFKIHEASGFTLVLTLHNLGGAFNVNVDDGASFDKNYTINNFLTGTINQAGFTVGGLPVADYTVTITKPATRIFLDAVQVYGTLQSIETFNDDQAVTAEGYPVFAFGPQNAWRTSTTSGAINGTLNTASRHGSVVSFIAGTASEPASGFRLYYPINTTSTSVEVCWTQLNNNIGNRSCLTTTLADRLRQKDILFSSGVGDTVDASGIFGVTIANMLNGRSVIVDAIMPLSGSAEPLQAGIYDATDSRLALTGTWLTEYNNSFLPNGRLVRSQTANASMTFEFEGTGFEIGTILDRLGGELEICYAQGAGATSFDDCFTYQNELAATQNRVSRTIVGLPNDVYTVRVRDTDDGRTTLVRNNANALRTGSNLRAKIGMRYITIFNQEPATGIASGQYNEDARDANGQLYLQTYPQNLFRTFADRNASNGTVVTAFNNDSVGTFFGGQTAVLSVNKQAGQNLSVVLYVRPYGNNTQQLLVCAGNERSGTTTWNGLVFGLSGANGTCVLKTGLNVATAITVDSNELSALGGTNSGNIRISYTPLLAGRFDVDGFQVYRGTTLSEGLHDDFLPDTLLNFNRASGTGQVNRAASGCNQTIDWCVLKVGTAYGGTVVTTRETNAALTFNVQGTGFSVFTTVDSSGMPFRICYKRTNNTQAFPAFNANATNTNQNRSVLNLNVGQTGANAIWCDYQTTRTATTGIGAWATRNFGRVNPGGTTVRYGFSYYGMPFGNYTVEVRLGTAPTTSSRFQLDAVGVFGSVTDNPTLNVGLYDDTNSSLSFEPAPLWTNFVSRNAPPSGPYGLSERNTLSAGAIAQVSVRGNSVILYQATSSKGTRDARMCLVVTGANIHCTEDAVKTIASGANAAWERAIQLAQFSQFGATTRFSPIMFYGLGESKHLLIVENRDNNRILSIDAIEVKE